MTRPSSALRLDPDVCDRCGRCERVCEARALKVGPSYIYVDWRACTGCMECVDACDRAAIVSKSNGVRTAAAAGKPLASSSPKSEKAAQAAMIAKRPGAARGAWTLVEAGAVLAVVFAVFMIKDAAMASSWVKTLKPSSAVNARVAILIAFYGVQVGTLIVLARMRGVGFADAFTLGRLGTPWISKLRSAAYVVGLLAATRVLAIVYLVATGLLGWDPPTRWNSDLTSVFGPNAAGFALSVLLVVVIAPVVEELVFRGVLQQAFETRWEAGVAIASGAALFGAYHFTVWLFVPTFVLGLAAGWLAHARESLWPAIALHALYNLVAVAVLFWPLV
ncbi:MAG: CPBP family glutamic-type intramembrane protease [Actinomycetota bacterium]|nr:CPBP family glutamic-type intramembrane protease [Actinomycetota bacterium]